jgi:hypothetical protein
LLAPIIEEFGGPSRQALSYWARRPLVDRFGNVVGFAAALLSSVIAVAGAGTSGKTPIGF